MPNSLKLALLYWHRTFECRARLDFALDLSAMFDKERGYKHFAWLARKAYADEPRKLAMLLDAITRRK